MSADQDYQYKNRETEDMSHKFFRLGEGNITGYTALFLGSLSFLAVLCFQYPSYLTTPELRAVYDAVFLQQILKWAMWISLGFSGLTFIKAKRRKLGAIGFLFTAAGFAMGGYSIPTGSVELAPVSLGLDWMILALLGSVSIFVFLEKVFPKYPNQAILRPEWKLDMFYFVFNHLLFALLILTGNYFVTTVFGWAANANLQDFIQALPIFVQVIVLMLCADFVLYWSHRSFHEVPFLWKFHAVHHSVEHMDWLAGSRNHVVQTFADRSLAMIPLYLLGPDKEALDLYVLFAGIQAVVVHANFGINFGPLKYIICTPQYHHWHHSSESPAIDTNYAVHSPLFDMLFKTHHMPDEHWPAHYGTRTRLPRNFLEQLMYPFKKG